MRFTFAATAALFGAAIAAPAPQVTPHPDPRETVTLSKFKAFHQLVEGPVNEISLQLTTRTEAGVAAYICTAANRTGPLDLTASYRCNNAQPNKNYGFFLHEVDTAANTYNLTILHQTSIAFGLWGQVKLPTVCRPEGVRSEYCEQQEDVNVELHAYE